MVIGYFVIGHSAVAARPNILLILADDLGYGDVGFDGSKDIPTTAVDRLAAGGATFSSAYVVHAFCGFLGGGILYFGPNQANNAEDWKRLILSPAKGAEPGQNHAKASRQRRHGFPHWFC